MSFTHYDLGNLEKGRVVEIILQGNAANVQLLDSANFSNYINGRRYQYIGGLAKQSPIRLKTTHASHWHIAIDLRGLRGNVRSSVRILPQALPAIHQTALSEVPSLFLGRETPPTIGDLAPREYDVFISHASEDKDDVVRPLAKSNFGIVVISRDFIKKGWTNYELDGLITRSISGEQQLLPIWHNITKKEVIEYSPSLADKVARNTAVNTVEEIAGEIAEVIRHT